jgi:hypothetical protein
VDSERYRVLHAEPRRFSLAGPRMARLHRMNISTWRRDALALAFDASELDRLSDELEALSLDQGSSVTVEYSMGELALERR